ncbi:MAG TPA: winged helix-turn-helix domain-containing protein [Myxococcota bacterium]|nr:winged helix-turn-helix domain-containing protein [Myxococcota bacterium]HQP94866.1 winged helix-turn-helix domain-containing protein [Myxococcota bacterium]
MEGDPGIRILLVEDDLRLGALVSEFLVSKGFLVDIEVRGDLAPDRIIDENPDLVILDLMLPGLDGLSICRKVRPVYPGPIMMLTALSDEVDEVVGLEVGADDYLAKPVRPRLLLARIHNLLRRMNVDGEDRTITGDRVITIEDLVIDPGSRSVRLGSREIDLTTAEFDLLYYLAERVGQVIDRNDIYRDLRGMEWDGLDRSIDLRVARLRRKIGDDARHPRRIKSVRGSGYLLVDKP